MRNSYFFPGNCGQGEEEKAVNEERGGLRCWEGGIPAYHDATEIRKGVFLGEEFIEWLFKNIACLNMKT